LNPAIDEKTIQAYLVELERTGRYGPSARAAGMSYGTLRRMRARDSHFEDDERDAMNFYCENVLEAALHKRGVDGWDEPKFHNGKVCGHIRRFDGSLLAMHVKRHNPAYKDKSPIDATFNGGVLIVEKPCDTEKEWREEFTNDDADEGE